MRREKGSAGESGGGRAHSRTGALMGLVVAGLALLSHVPTAQARQSEEGICGRSVLVRLSLLRIIRDLPDSFWWNSSCEDIDLERLAEIPADTELLIYPFSFMPAPVFRYILKQGDFEGLGHITGKVTIGSAIFQISRPFQGLNTTLTTLAINEFRPWSPQLLNSSIFNDVPNLTNRRQQQGKLRERQWHKGADLPLQGGRDGRPVPCGTTHGQQSGVGRRHLREHCVERGRDA